GVPDAVAVINPHQPGCPYPYRFLSGVGLVFKLAVGVRRRLHEHGWPAGRLPNLQQHLDLFGLGTIADLAPLTGENHLLSVHGLEAMRNTEKPGLIALKAVAGCTGRLDSFAVGFKLGPRLNAAGRLGKADAGFHLLVTEDPDAAMRLAGELDALNTLRKKTQDEVQEEAEYLLQREVDLEEDRVIVLESPNFHPGVIGIVASRLVEKHFRPVVLVAFAGGVGKGSARSIPSFHLHRAFTECADHLLQFGGHAYAAGLTIEKNRLEGFREALNAVGCRVLRAEHLIPEIRIDAEVTLKELDWELFREVRQLEPYGQLNPTPVFLARGTTCKNPRVIGKGRDHVRFTAGQGAARLEAVGFGMAAAWRGLESKDRLDLVFELHSNDFSGVPKLELKLLDLRPAP
ncbi:MAG: DHH family phosphoesterase, partial [Nitrospinaceae bacterium]